MVIFTIHLNFLSQGYNSFRELVIVLVKSTKKVQQKYLQTKVKVCPRVKDITLENITGFEVAFEEMPMGGAALDAVGVPLPDETLNSAKKSDATLLGAIGG